MAGRVGTMGVEKLALIIGMIWLAIWSSIGYVMILWMRARVEYHFRIPIAHSHGLCFTIVFLVAMIAMMRSEAHPRVKQGIVGIGLVSVIGYPLSQLAEIIGIKYLTDFTEILFVIFLLAMVYIVYKMKL